ncbi:PIH1 domain-containing protein 2 [Rhinoraja longicauda]
MATGRSELLQQVNQLWSVLDEMSESSPEAYGKFISHQLAEGMKHCSAPEPRACIQTNIQEPGERVLFINLCSWSRVPAPKGNADPVPLSGGLMEETVNGTDTCCVTDVAYSPEVIQKAKEDPVERDQLIRLAMRYIEEQHSVRLSHSYRLLGQTQTGSTERIKQRLSGRSDPDQAVTVGAEANANASLLQQLTSLREAGGEQNSPIHLPTQTHRPNKPGLIQEISSVDFECSNTVETPKYKMSVITDEGGKPTSIQLKVELPEVSSVADCGLSVSKDDVVIDVAAKYRLQLNLPETICEDMVIARFSRKTLTLSVRMPILTK